MDLAKSVLVPKSPLAMRAELPRREPEILASWRAQDLYAKIRAARAGKPVFLLHDGPPYANGEIHMGHALNKTLKDIIVRYKTSRGFDAPYVPGWDCHGLPIEREAMKKVKPGSSRPEIRRHCRTYAETFIDKQRKGFIRLGCEGDWANPYLTMASAYQAKILEAFREIWSKNLVYRALKPIHWCAECRTALAEAEVEYAPHTSPSITVAFPFADASPRAAVIWTTTPWTLPANLAVAVHPELSYAEVRPSGSEQTYLVAEPLLMGTASDAGWASPEILSRRPGRELEGTRLRHPFLDREVPVILADFVTTETGTGLVHIAPGHGADDYVVGRKYGLEVLSPVDDAGRFTPEAGLAELAGKKVFEANARVVEILRERNALLALGSLEHSYPHCWRCREAILFRATPQWFLKIDPLRAPAKEAIDEVQWIPEWGKDRFAKTVEARPDWCLSRQRAWGVPIPAARCAAEGCGEVFLDEKIFASLIAATRAESADAWFLRGPEFLAGSKCPKCGGTDITPETDILDVWFDSGVSWFAVGAARPDLRFPADLYLEGSDQHRGWFQTSFWPALALTGAPPYKAVLTHGFLLDGEGRPMSKSLGNVISPDEVTKEYGADVCRLWVASQNYREDLRLSKDILAQVAESYKKIRNTWRFLLGNVAGFDDPTASFDPARDPVPFASLESIDRFALDRLGRYLEAVRRAYDAYDFTQIHRDTIDYFVRDLSGVYLDVVKDRLYCEAPTSSTRRSAQTVVHHILSSTLRALAPILVFTTEEVWNLLPGAEGSIHLADFPDAGPYRDAGAEKDWTPLAELLVPIQAALEAAKNENRIKRSFEAEVTLPLESAQRRALAGREVDLALLARVARVSTAETGVIRAERTQLHKCPRCWRHIELGPEGLCARCDAVLAAAASIGPRA